MVKENIANIYFGNDRLVDKFCERVCGKVSLRGKRFLSLFTLVHSLIKKKMILLNNQFLFKLFRHDPRFLYKLNVSKGFTKSNGAVKPNSGFMAQHPGFRFFVPFQFIDLHIVQFQLIKIYIYFVIN